MAQYGMNFDELPMYMGMSKFKSCSRFVKCKGIQQIVLQSFF